MSDNQSITNSPSKTKNKRRPWLQRRLRHQNSKQTSKEPEQTARSEEKSEDLNIMPPQPLDIQARRASVPDASHASITPVPALVEWASTQSCPTTAVGETHAANGSEARTPLPTIVASEANTPETVVMASHTDTRDALAHTMATNHNMPQTHPVSGTSEHQIFTTLSNNNFFVPSNATLNAPSLFLFKRDTPALERFRLLHNQLFVELSRVSVELLQPSADRPAEASVEAYKEREEIMLGLLTEVVPALNHFAETVGREVGKGCREQRAGLRLWAGERGENEGRPI